MNGLAICAGIGGIELGLRLVLGEQYRCALYLEREAYAVEILYRRMQEGWLDEAPVHPDVQTFDGRSWRGKIDIITSGFPCQPWSVAGQRRGVEDERWIWPDIARIVGDVRPRFVFLENVPALASGGGLWAVLESLAALGFDARWDSFRASDVGAPHRRERIFILAYARREHMEGGEQIRSGDSIVSLNGNGGRNMGHARCECLEGIEQARAASGTTGRAGNASVLPRWPPGPTELDRWAEVLAIDPTVEPAICRMVDGVPIGLHRVDRLRCLGNAVIPAVAALAWTELTRRMNGG